MPVNTYQVLGMITITIFLIGVCFTAGSYADVKTEMLNKRALLDQYHNSSMQETNVQDNNYGGQFVFAGNTKEESLTITQIIITVIKGFNFNDFRDGSNLSFLLWLILTGVAGMTVYIGVILSYDKILNKKHD